MRRIVLISLIVGLAAVAFGQDFKLGSKVDDFTLYDTKGKAVQFSSLKGDVTVILFIATQCPISNDYNERMKAIYSDYASKGVKFVAINSNHTEPAEEVEQHRIKNGFQFAVYKDPDNKIADRFAAQFTPEVFVLDKTGTIRYHGYIDDSRKGDVKHPGLRLALDALLAGKEVERPETKAFGCTIKRVKKAT
ncbi:MAG: redoxin domain-containing protein [Bryobacterales bacterium]|nr:redoxin domain-containing protein [Bryobacteraceae bacterium]MDW8355288.1 redoxin domain-containing protein [Bryobacterales bacterium]